MIFRRILRYGIAFLIILFIISCICLYQYRDALAAYFSSFFSSAVGIGLYVLIFAAGIGLMLKALFK